MRLYSIIIVFVLAGAAPLPDPAQETQQAGSGTAAGCVKWESEARFVAYGYNHLVHLENTCKKAMHCEVTTDVNPKPQSADLEPGKKETVVTFQGSPASEFKATVVCEEKS